MQYEVESRARDAIEQLKYRYWRACDAKDPDGFRDCFVATGGELDFGPLGRPDPDTMVGIFRKMHIPDDPGFYEKFYFTPGDAEGENLGFKPVETRLGKLGVLVCWDQWYPEAARLMAMAGAEILLYPTAIGWDPDDTADEQQRQKDAWTLIQRSHAVANHLPVLVANRTGHESDPAGQGTGISFWGGSFIAGQQGEMLAVADTDSACYLVADLELARTEQLAAEELVPVARLDQDRAALEQASPRRRAAEMLGRTVCRNHGASVWVFSTRAARSAFELGFAYNLAFEVDSFVLVH